MNKNIVLDIPLFRQLFDPALWQENNFLSQDDSYAWSNRSCGIASLKMCLEYLQEYSPSMKELLEQGIKNNALSERGWIHKKLIEMANAYNVDGLASTATIDDIYNHLKNKHPVIASVTEKFPCDGRKGGHLIVIKGIEFNNGQPDQILFNDPSAWGQENSSVSFNRFMCSFSGRIITLFK